MKLAAIAGRGFVVWSVISMLGAAATRAEVGAIGLEAGDGEVWITLERGVLEAFEATEVGAVVVAPPPAGESDRRASEIVAVPFSEERIVALGSYIHETRRVCGGFVAHESQAAALTEVERAAGITSILPPAPMPYTIDKGAVVQALMAQMSAASIASTITSLEGFNTRYHLCHSTLNSAGWIKALWEGYAAGRRDVKVELFNHPPPPSGTPQPSVVLTILAGTSVGPAETETVILGAHQDSIRSGSSSSNCTTTAGRSPGADDDGSGIAVLSEVIRVAMATGYSPKKNVQFMAYAAEEVGLRGSGDIAQTYLQQGRNVIGVLQLDMTNYKGSVNDIHLYTDFTNAAQNAFLGQLVDTYLPGITRSTSACGYACSDHASWTNRGFVASFPFEAVFGEHSPFIHTSTDTLANNGGNASQSLKFAKLAAAYLAELAKGGFNPPPVAPAIEAGTSGMRNSQAPRRRSVSSRRSRNDGGSIAGNR